MLSVLRTAVVAFVFLVPHPLEQPFAVDFQLGRQDGPKTTCRAAVRVWNAADPAVPRGADRA